MSKRKLPLIIGAVGIACLIVAGILLWREKSREAGETGVLTPTDFTFATAVGKKAPDFTLPDINGKEVALSSLRGKYVILFFSEGLACLPCAEQIIVLMADKGLNNNEVVSFSIVTESLDTWQKLRSKAPAVADLNVLFDSEAKVSGAYDTLNLPSSMSHGLPGHTYFIIDKNGTIRFTLDDHSMGLRNEELVTEIEKIKM